MNENNMVKAVRSNQSRGAVIHCQRFVRNAIVTFASLQEFEKLGEDDEVHKQVGPVLVKVPVSDAKAAVENRLRFIEEQVKSVERSIETKTAEQDAQREKIIEFQKKNAAAIAGAAAGGAKEE